MRVKYLDIEYLRAQNASTGQVLLAGSNSTLTYTNYITVDVGGNVGIGTSTPDNTLTVHGNVHVTGTNSSLIFPDGTIQTSAGHSSDGTAGAVQFSGNNGSFTSNQSNLFWDSSNLRLGIGTSVPVSTLQIKSTAIESTIFSWSGTNTEVIDSIPVQNVRSAHYFVQVTDTDNNEYHISQITVLQDGSNAYKSEYNIVTNVERLGDYDCDVISGNLVLTFTAYQSTNKTAKITRTSMTA